MILGVGPGVAVVLGCRRRCRSIDRASQIVIQKSRHGERTKQVHWRKIRCCTSDGRWNIFKIGCLGGITDGQGMLSRLSSVDRPGVLSRGTTTFDVNR
jgi:hypothetical protein